MLRAVTAQDIEQIRAWRNQDFIRTSFIDQGMISEEQQRLWFERYVNAADDQMFLIIEKEPSCRPVGTAALYRIDRQQLTAEFGRLMIGEPTALGKGYGQEATRLLCKHAFRHLGLKQLYLEVLENNLRAIRIYRQCGFKPSSITEKNGLRLMKMVLHEYKAESG
ncbi:GNAT family N-acetyltransferase [Paenibacillus sp. y28]|uniref:GNAT family N-acetyltransferase n=1 Tax=Paenibacillus sp. y28 TaxID=3129110 RepID=UPI0030167D94